MARFIRNSEVAVGDSIRVSSIGFAEVVALAEWETTVVFGETARCGHMKMSVNGSRFDRFCDADDEVEVAA